jgi:hypothetical protein
MARSRLGSGPRAKRRTSAFWEQEVGRMPSGSSPKRERQYEHIKDSAKQRGESTGRAEEIAARTSPSITPATPATSPAPSPTGTPSPTTS